MKFRQLGEPALKKRSIQSVKPPSLMTKERFASVGGGPLCHSVRCERKVTNREKKNDTRLITPHTGYLWPGYQ